MNDEAKPAEGVVDSRPGVMGIHATRAVEFLKHGKPGDTVTRERMADIIGRSCKPQEQGYGNVLSAINRVEVDFRVVWRWVRSIAAWKCLDDSERLGVTKDAKRGAVKKVRRGMRVAGTIDVASLSDEEKKEYGMVVAASGVMALCGGSGFVKRLEQVDKPKEPDMGRLIELMR